MYGLLFFIPLILGIVQLIKYALGRFKDGMAPQWILVEFVCMVAYPIVYLYSLGNIGNKNDCCTPDSPVLSPDHWLSIWVLIALVDCAFFFSFHRKKLLSPVAEVAINSLLLIGIILNIALVIQDWNQIGFLGMNFFTIIFYLIFALHKNHELLMSSIERQSFENSNPVLRIFHMILSSAWFIKFPILLLFCLPLLAVIVMILLLFGQRPDSMIQAFTDTYHHTLSAHDCTNVDCPHSGHYLCTIAANGHEEVVKPIRTGIRHNDKIKVNRQLLVANAFEELLEEHLPTWHKPIRRNYDKVGEILYSSQRLLNNKWMADLVYLAMKPLEWFFILTLYTLDKNPENRIARQYISAEHSRALKNI
jgi:hypothetical protein